MCYLMEREWKGEGAGVGWGGGGGKPLMSYKRGPGLAAAALLSPYGRYQYIQKRI